MELSDEDKLTVNSELFYTIRTYIRKNKPAAEITAKIDKVLKDGADIDACDRNDSNNTILHIAAQKENKELVIHLLKKGAQLFCNDNGYTAKHLALKNNTCLGNEIADIISKEGKLAIRNTKNNSRKPSLEAEPSRHNNSITTPVNDEEFSYQKRAGTSGVSGQFYETKLLCLVAHRALHDTEIQQFYLAANIKDIGDFDDVCFRYGNVACFMQTKHRENTDKAKLTTASVRSSTGKLGLGIYFDSFLKIRQKFTPNTNDPMFKGKYEEIKIYFVLYTPLKESFDRKLSGNKEMCQKLHNLIYTGEKDTSKYKSTDIFQFDYEPHDLIFLTKYIKYENMKTLAKNFLEFILSNNKLEVMMANDLVKIYHPALAQKVIYIFQVVKPPKTTKSSKSGHLTNTVDTLNYINMGRFRPDFFYSDDYYLIILKDTFFKEIVYTHSPKTGFSKEEIKQKIQDIADNPCAETISQLIGSPIKFDDSNDKLYLDVNKLPKNKYKQEEIQQIRYNLQKIQVTKTMVRDAVYLAGKKKLEILSFRLPQTFGNIDLTTNQKSVEGNLARLDFLAGKFHSLINHFSDVNNNKETKVIEINSNVVGPGKILELSHLNSNGGIGGTVGNLLQFDIQSELFLFNTKENMGENANYVLRKLKQLTNEDLSKFKINIRIDGFPRVSFDIYNYDQNIAAEFMSKLWFYTNQAQEESVETTIKEEINKHYNADKQRNQFLFHVHSDAIFLRFHDEIQKWWKKQTKAQYLTKSTKIFEKAKKDIVDSPLLTVLNLMFVRKTKNIAIEFNINAIDSLNLTILAKRNVNKALNIVSDAVILTALKIMQYRKNQNMFTFINIDYVYSLPKNDYETMIQELKLLKSVTLVIISEAYLNRNVQTTLENILNAFTDHYEIIKKQVIIITRELLHIEKSQNFHSYDYLTLKDNKINLVDLTAQSQEHFLNQYEILYQGQQVKLSTIIDDDSKELVDAKLICTLLNKERIEVGQTLYTHKYHEIKKYYIDRNVTRNGEDYVFRTLDDVDSNVVLISSKPCMGKTILLTHLALETKKLDPKPWIVLINMSAHMQEIHNMANISLNIVMSFLIKVALNNLDNTQNVNFIDIDEEKVSIDCDNLEDISFELQLFIHFYNNGNIIFLFDGFDKICPYNTNEGLKLLTALHQANKRMWITSDSYVIKILERQFGKSYELDRLSKLQQKSFLERFWTTNLELEKLNHDQCDNLLRFFNFISKTFNKELSFDADNDSNDRNVMPFLSVPLHVVYLTILNHFKNESNSLSPCYIREIIKKKWRLDSYSRIDHFLRSNREESLELAGTPLHMYIAANYFAFQITDKFSLDIDTKTIIDRSNLYINTVGLYERFLKVNIKNICEIENKASVEDVQEKLRDEFFERHKKLAIYTICKESDIKKFLTDAEICEVKKTIKMIESGEMKTHLIDHVIDGVPRFYHLLFAEYFIVETLSDLLKRMKNNELHNSKFDSMWDFLVNIVLLIGPPSLRNAFEYKLKYDPELAEAMNSDYNTKVMFELLVKQREEKNENAIDIAINEGLVNITNLLIKIIRNNVDSDDANRWKIIIQSSANIIGAVDTSRSVLSEDVLQCLQNMDGESMIKVLNSTPVGSDIQEKIKTNVVEPLRKLTEKIVEASSNNENLVRLTEQLPNHLPDIIRAMFEK